MYTILTLPLSAAFLFLAQANNPMHDIAQTLADNLPGVIIVSLGGVTYIIKQLSERFGKRIANSALEDAADAKRKVQEIENAAAVEKQETQNKLDMMRLEVENNRIQSEAYEQAQKTIQEQLELLKRQADLYERTLAGQEKNTTALTDAMRVLSSNSSVLVGNVEELGEIREVIKAHSDETDESMKTVIKKLEDANQAIDGLRGEMSTLDTNVMGELQKLSAKVQLLLEDTGKVIPLCPDAESKANEPTEPPLDIAS